MELREYKFYYKTQSKEKIYTETKLCKYPKKTKAYKELKENFVKNSNIYSFGWEFNNKLK